MASENEKTFRLRNINLIIRPGDPLYTFIHKMARRKRQTATQFIRYSLLNLSFEMEKKENEDFR